MSDDSLTFKLTMPSFLKWLVCTSWYISVLNGCLICSFLMILPYWSCSIVFDVSVSLSKFKYVQSLWKQWYCRITTACWFKNIASSVRDWTYGMSTSVLFLNDCMWELKSIWLSSATSITSKSLFSSIGFGAHSLKAASAYGFSKYISS